MLRLLIASSFLSFFAMSGAISSPLYASTETNTENNKVNGKDIGKDNSKVNAEILANGEVTSQDQGTSNSDVELTRKIRQAVVARDSFSMYAKNIKIIAINRVVTLKGPVKSTGEKSDLKKIAKASGAKKVVDEISIE